MSGSIRWSMALAMLVLNTASLSWAQPAKKIKHFDIYSGSQKFDSIKEYRQHKLFEQLKEEEESKDPDLQELEVMFKEVAKTQDDPSAFHFDPTRVKTIVINPISYSKRQKLGRVNMDGAVVKEIDNFNKNQKNDPVSIEHLTADQVEGTIKNTLKNHDDPFLILSDQERLRIMTFKRNKKKETP